MQAILTFVFDKETKRTIRYAETCVAEGARPAVGYLYVDKALAGEVKRLQVTLESIP